MARTNPQQFIHMNLTDMQIALVTQITFPAVVGAEASIAFARSALQSAIDKLK